MNESISVITINKPSGDSRQTTGSNSDNDTNEDKTDSKYDKSSGNSRQEP